MIYRTEFRSAGGIRIEQVINDEELIDIVNEYLVHHHYVTDKEDEESIPELELDFIFSILNGEINRGKLFRVYRKENTSTWTEDWIDDIVDECVREYFYNIPVEIVDLGEIVYVEYEKETD